MINANIERVYEQIESACAACGRSSKEIKLMAVSKFQPIESIAQAYSAGLRLFGESRVQETAEKLSGRGNFPQMELHMIGALQRNKVKDAFRLFDCVQSVDRNELIESLAKHAAAAAAKPLDILLELNAGEESKTGYPDVDALFGAVDAVLAAPGLRLRGLMTMAPFVNEEKPIRRAFRSLKTAADKLSARYPQADFSVLSMGMSGDFRIAIEEGSTMLRIGTAIFGERT
ncbi:MAG: YggS family pyridoxal phosphate-dependent enzyme [Spirochaetaceae bacterium]|jgi:pyridoxal phosphate enzyme (YggS family)|nr:YggS family pyridoxal phosphate-dependent enzyme [Spirochaetaceae bacterium]